MSVQGFIQYFQQCSYEQSQVEDILQALTFQSILKYEYGGPRVPPPNFARFLSQNSNLFTKSKVYYKQKEVLNRIMITVTAKAMELR